MIKRSEKVAFMECSQDGQTTYTRMTGFTEFSVSKNPKEYSRKYIDEDLERSEVVGYSPIISYKLDVDPKNIVHNFLGMVADNEMMGSDAKCNIMIADLSNINEDGSANAIVRAFSIIPGTEGDDKNTYTLSGSFKAIGEKKFGIATSLDNWQTVSFTEN